VHSNSIDHPQVLDSTAPKKNEEKSNVTTGTEECISEYRKDDIRSRRAALHDDEHADHKKRETDGVDGRRENCSNPRGDRINRSREPRSQHSDDADSNRLFGRGR
jgi:hypothetical protein